MVERVKPKSTRPPVDVGQLPDVFEQTGPQSKQVSCQLRSTNTIERYLNDMVNNGWHLMCPPVFAYLQMGGQEAVFLVLMERGDE